MVENPSDESQQATESEPATPLGINFRIRFVLAQTLVQGRASSYVLSLEGLTDAKDKHFALERTFYR